MQPAAPPSVQAPPAPLADPAARLAGAGFAMGCVQLLSAASSAADYAARVQAIGAQTVGMVPAADAARVRIEGVDGRTCRVSYTGVEAARLFATFADFKIDRMNGVCVEEPRTVDDASLSCRPGSNPGYSLSVTQSGVGPRAHLAAAMTYTAPATHSDRADPVRPRSAY